MEVRELIASCPQLLALSVHGIALELFQAHLCKRIQTNLRARACNFCILFCLQPAKLLEAPLTMIVSHPEHESIYVNDIACRSFGRETLRSVCNLMLDNLPTGALSRLIKTGVVHNIWFAICLLGVRSASACAALC